VARQKGGKAGRQKCKEGRQEGRRAKKEGRKDRGYNLLA
jgi:hypothetical protein